MSIFVSMQLELFLNAAELCLACYSVVTGILGMSIKYDWNNNHDYMFKWVNTIKLCFNTIFK
jgi:magnesium transporter